MRTLDPEKFAAQRQAILLAARTCFAREGFHRASTEAICKEAGMSSGKLFHYFHPKKALILAVVEDEGRTTADYLAELLRHPVVPEALSDFLDTVLATVANPPARQMILEIVAEAARDPDIQAANALGDRALATGLHALLEQGVANNQIHPIVPIPQAVHFLMVMIDGLFSRSTIEEPTHPFPGREPLQTILGALLGFPSQGRHDNT